MRAEGQVIDSQFDTNFGYRRDILKLPNGKIRAIDSWASPPFFMRMAVATAASEKAALGLLGRVERLRAKGGFGGMPILNFPSAPP